MKRALLKPGTRLRPVPGCFTYVNNFLALAASACNQLTLAPTPTAPSLTPSTFMAPGTRALGGGTDTYRRFGGTHKAIAVTA